MRCLLRLHTYKELIHFLTEGCTYGILMNPHDPFSHDLTSTALDQLLQIICAFMGTGIERKIQIIRSTGGKPMIKIDRTANGTILIRDHVLCINPIQQFTCPLLLLLIHLTASFSLFRCRNGNQQYDHTGHKNRHEYPHWHRIILQLLSENTGHQQQYCKSVKECHCAKKDPESSKQDPQQVAE